MRPRTILAAAVALLSACSLLAPSDEEAMRGLSATGGSDGGPPGRPDAESSSDGSTTDAPPKGVDCGGQICFACNDGVCAGCRLNGAKCGWGGDCCGGKCTEGTCREGSACTAAGAGCQSTSRCCADLTCGSADGGRSCQSCEPIDAPCVGKSDCCSDRCLASKCAPCLAEGTRCTDDGECCSGACDRLKDFCKPL